MKIIPVEEIIEFSEKMPKNLNDFNKKTIYSTKWMNETTNEEDIIAVLISDLFGK